MPPLPWSWTEQREQAALLDAGGKLTDKEIASELGFDRRQLTRWRKVPEYKERVRQLVAGISQEMQKRATFNREQRLQMLETDLRDLETVKQERAAMPEMADVPGGKTGLVLVLWEKTVAEPALVWKHKISGDKNDAPDAPGDPEKDPSAFKLVARTLVVCKHAVDTAFIRERRALSQQIAQERGEWKEEHVLTVKGDIVERLEAGRKRLAKAREQQSKPKN